MVRNFLMETGEEVRMDPAMTDILEVAKSDPKYLQAVDAVRRRLTKEQVNKYLENMELGLGIVCVDGGVQWVKLYLMC